MATTNIIAKPPTPIADARYLHYVNGLLLVVISNKSLVVDRLLYCCCPVATNDNCSENHQYLLETFRTSLNSH